MVLIIININVVLQKLKGEIYRAWHGSSHASHFILYHERSLQSLHYDHRAQCVLCVRVF